MSVPTTPQPPPAQADPSAVRLVLFGMPDAGKSSLLGALAQAAHTQARALHGRLTDLTHGLGELRNRVYDERQRETLEEIVPYPVVFDPYGAPPSPAVLYDCDGRAANDFLTSKRSLEKEGRAGALAQAILSADALILTIDASAPPTQIEDDFREFLRFLRYLQKYRAHEHAVGGLPVFLVLTKCDLLARETMNRAAWEARIQERQQEVVKRFKQFLRAEGQPGDMFAFGSLHMDVRATAVRHPGLADAAPLPREPFGVAELFHEAFADAVAFHQRRARAEKRLRWTVGGAAGFLLAMAAAGLFFLTTRTGPVEPTLADRVEALRAAEGPTAATRLGTGVDRRLQEWRAIQSDPGFPGLPDELKNLVRSRIEEDQAYLQFREELAAIPAPSQARSLAELGQIEARAQRLNPPAPYADDWALTDAGLQRFKLLHTEIPALRTAVATLTQFYFSLKNRATGLLQATEVTPEWDQAVRDLEAAAQVPPVPKSDTAQAPAYEYDDVGVAEADWQRTRERLVHVRDLATALGLLGDPTGATAPLALSAPAADANIPELGSRRWQNLKTHYPDYSKWSLALVPDALRPELQRRLRRSIDQANRDGQRLILEQLLALNTSGREEPADWPRVGEYLLSPPLQDWRDLVAFLNRLADPSAEDPVQATAAFVRRTSFEVDPRRVRVRIPDTLSDAPVRPAGDLTLVYRPAGADPKRVALRPEGEPQRDKQSLVYGFTGTGPAFTYRPGDRFNAELPVRKGDRDLKLTWTRARAESFQFEALWREPRLHAPDQNYLEGVVADGVTVAVTEGRFPVVPPMVPAVRFEKK